MKVKADDGTGPDDGDAAMGATDESIFSASLHGKDFFVNLLDAHSIKGFIDLAIGQCEALKACLELRIPSIGFALGEVHAQKAEMLLTDHILTMMRTEGTTYYRPEAAESLAAEDDGDDTKKDKDNKRKSPPRNPSPTRIRSRRMMRAAHSAHVHLRRAARRARMRRTRRRARSRKHRSQRRPRKRRRPETRIRRMTAAMSLRACHGCSHEL